MVAALTAALTPARVYAVTLALATAAPPALTTPDNVGVPGVTAALAADAGEVPTALAAVTVNVYAVPLVKPDTVELTPAVVIPVHAGHAGDDAIVYPVIAEPPSETGAVHDTTA